MIRNLFSMKKSIAILGFFIVLASFQDASAQLSRKEKKEWKKKQKGMDPEEFKNLIEENSSLQAKLSTLNGELSGLQTRLSDREAQNADLKSQVNSLETKLLASEANEDEAMDVTGNKTRSTKGVVFKVQIGAYKNKDLSKYQDQGESFSAEAVEGVEKYTLGSFTDYWEADKFKKHLRQMGVKDAWIVPYKDGTRVAIKDVLEGVI